MNNIDPFKYPNVTGISYSFTDDGYFEEAQYRFLANGLSRFHFCCIKLKLIPTTCNATVGSSPQCVEAVVIWQHGRYTILPNNSIALDPSVFAADGRVQVQNPCSATTKLLTYYQQPVLFAGWEMAIDLNRAAYSMQLLRFDGSLLPRFAGPSQYSSLASADLSSLIGSIWL
jgi:hypothetical protein